jgi:glycosyltransferase involved in cell wall biosynthesis
MINILFIHQSAELYGSDKTLLLLLSRLDKSKFNSVVVIPFEGPLKQELEKHQIKVEIAPVLKLYRKMFSPRNLLKFISDRQEGISQLDQLHAKYHFDIVYSNTLAVLLGVQFANNRNIKHLWHVHEIIESPKLFTNLFLQLLKSRANSNIVYNSIASQNFWDKTLIIKNKSKVIWNGLENFYESSIQEKLEVRKNYFNANADEIVIALVGRISRWKGQLLLLEAFNTIAQKNEDVKLVFIGSPPPNQDNFLENLENKITELDLSNKVKIIPFQKEISVFWQSIDIAVVPSTEPEPFGLVAVEGMLAKKPVVASNHGGLTEIVINNKTGYLVTPNDQTELYNALVKLIENKKNRITFGENGYQRAQSFFFSFSYFKSFL